MQYCNHPEVCPHFNLLKGKCEIANHSVDMVGGGNLVQHQHLYARIPNCFETRREAADAAGDEQ